VGSYPVGEFLRGLAAGTVALIAAAALACGRRTRKPRPRRGRPDERPVWSQPTRAPWPPAAEPVTGLLMTAAALGAISRTWSVGVEVLLGMGGVAVAAIGSTRWRSAGPVPVVLAVVVGTASACLLAANASSIAWVRGLVVAGVLLGGSAASRTDDAWGATGLPPVLYAVTAAGVFVAVPDTEEAAALLGASVPAALAAWPFGRARLGSTGAATATALLVWVAAVGARGRPPSIVGAAACLGLLVTLAAGRCLARLSGWSGTPQSAPRPVMLLVAHTAVVALASRVAGVSSELEVAAPVAAAAGVAAVAGAVAGGRPVETPAER
jgi:hypothetical protein